MLQVDFTCELLKEARKRGISTAMETGGYASRENYRKVLPYVDEFLWDYKETDERKHEKFTGVSNQGILNNLRYVHNQGASITLRCPVIPGLNDTEEHFKGIADISRGLDGLKGVELMPYHSMGVAKGMRLGTIQQKEYHVPSKEETETWKQRIIQLGGRIS
ncbi:MAG: radical SAM protein [Clostridiales bacterium]|nr:radical SAM protein [Clostridiales bacterium]